MKKFVIASISVLIGAQMSFAQLTDAVIAFESLEMKQAKTSIDKYMLKEKALVDPKGWLYKGKIYQFISGSDKPEIKSLLTEDATKTIIEAYQKAIENDKTKQQEYSKQAKEQLETVYATAFNEGIKKYQENNFKGALDNMVLCQQLKPTDTLAYTVGASIAIQTKDFAIAKKAYYDLISKGFRNYTYYKNLLYITSEEEKNSEEALKVIQMGREQFPNDATFMAQEVNIYIASGKTKEAVEKLENASTKDPANSKIYFYNLGILYKQTNDNVKAKEYFAKSLAVDAEYEGANYMTGFMLMEEGDVVNKKLNNMTLKEYNATGKKDEIKRDDLYKKALPYLEKAYFQNKDESVKAQLISIYKKFKMEDKIQKLN
ncbi:MAG: tetratricopeptide repeat protein [Cytophagales bacterium]